MRLTPIEKAEIIEAAMLKLDASYEEQNINNGVGLAFLNAIEEQGFTIYKKKVPRNKRRPNCSPAITPEMRRQIKLRHLNDPEITQSQLAAQFNVNIGRIAEILS